MQGLPVRAPGARAIRVRLRVLKLQLLGWQRGAFLRASGMDTWSSPDQRSTMGVQPALGSESVSPAPGLPGGERVGSWLCPGAVPWAGGESNHSLASPGAARVVGRKGRQMPRPLCPEQPSDTSALGGAGRTRTQGSPRQQRPGGSALRALGSPRPGGDGEPDGRSEHLCFCLPCPSVRSNLKMGKLVSKMLPKKHH